MALVELAGASMGSNADAGEVVSLVYVRASDPQAEIDRLLQVAAEHAAWVVWDVGDVIPDFHPAQDTELTAKVVTIGGFDERIPGWRMGWMAGSEAATRLRAFKQSITICSTSVSQWATLGIVGVS